MNKEIEKFIKKENEERNLYDESLCGGVTGFMVLEDEEANLVDEAIRLYKLPFEISEHKNKIIDCETDDSYDVEEGLSYIYEAILEDNGELLDKYMNVDNQKKLYKLLIWA